MSDDVKRLLGETETWMRRVNPEHATDHASNLAMRWVFVGRELISRLAETERERDEVQRLRNAELYPVDGDSMTVRLARAETARDEAAVRTMELKRRLDTINELLTDAWDADKMDYTCTQSVNVAHGIAAGGPMPRPVVLRNGEVRDA